MEGRGDFHGILIAQGKRSELLGEGRPRLNSKKGKLLGETNKAKLG